MRSAHIAFAAGWGWVLLVAFRSIRRRSSLAAAIVAAGILSRAVLGLILFWISYLQFPALRSLQLGDGFWTPMADAKFYVRDAVTAAGAGFAALGPHHSSPFYVKTLAVWMTLVGVSPAAGLFLNLSIYIVLCALIVRVFEARNEWRTDLPCVVSVAAFSFSPVALVHSTQALKEDLFTLLVALVSVGLLWLFRALLFGEPSGRARPAFAGALCVVFGAIYGLAGIRAYYALIVWLTLACALAAFGCSAVVRGRSRLVEHAAASLLVLGVLWLAYWQGSGAEYWGPTRASFPAPANAVSLLEGARAGFDRSGDTSMVMPDVAARPGFAAATTGRLRARVESMLIGVAAQFVPVSVLKRLSLVTFSGGRGLLPLADLDTLFFDVSIATCLALLYLRRTTIGHNLPFVLFALCLSAFTAALLAYVVTTFGVLFRLRAMIAVPLWLLCLGPAREDEGYGAPSAGIVTAANPAVARMR